MEKKSSGFVRDIPEYRRFFWRSETRPAEVKNADRLLAQNKEDFLKRQIPKWISRGVSYDVKEEKNIIDEGPDKKPLLPHELERLKRKIQITTMIDQMVNYCDLEEDGSHVQIKKCIIDKFYSRPEIFFGILTKELSRWQLNSVEQILADLMAPEDLKMIAFFDMTRDDANLALRDYNVGTWLIRPSSYHHLEFFDGQGKMYHPISSSYVLTIKRVGGIDNYFLANIESSGWTRVSDVNKLFDPRNKIYSTLGELLQSYKISPQNAIGYIPR